MTIDLRSLLGALNIAFTVLKVELNSSCVQRDQIGRNFAVWAPFLRPRRFFFGKKFAQIIGKFLGYC